MRSTEIPREHANTSRASVTNRPESRCSSAKGLLSHGDHRIFYAAGRERPARQRPERLRLQIERRSPNFHPYRGHRRVLMPQSATRPTPLEQSVSRIQKFTPLLRSLFLPLQTHVAEAKCRIPRHRHPKIPRLVVIGPVPNVSSPPASPKVDPVMNQRRRQTGRSPHPNVRRGNPPARFF